MPSDAKAKGPASDFPSIERTYGESVAHCFAVLDALPGQAHNALVAYDRAKHP